MNGMLSLRGAFLSDLAQEKLDGRRCRGSPGHCHWAVATLYDVGRTYLPPRRDRLLRGNHFETFYDAWPELKLIPTESGVFVVKGSCIYGFKGLSAGR